jgi:broad specificity phosphatase PhoE
MKFRIIRHAQTGANVNGRLACDDNEELTKHGHHQSELLSKYLETVKIDAVWCSPLLRARQTIEPFLQNSSIEPIIFDELAEGSFNLANGAPVLKDWRKGGDPLGVFRGRVSSFVNSILGTVSEGDVVVISHGHFIREFINLLLDAGRYARWPVGNCSETMFEVGDSVMIHHVNKVVI